ncbi:site-2 protease. Metallo peptidase. MEROPS family M50B [Thermosyntropha lipolytica DSM 11003]|uniref:Zinc metalloprotease n=1 Tax=Thermosyntropha lipolytica DSM 11003 TaxID=1123382 RepID=A0A1M5KX50_9FIRM|nr:RIP metalloprotease RseP [Thermosyntropha lipolytica]SHG57089.1 site-2 protease. Metallo peptidase. MEROPS family M50B [Thermosyntropha lipolytica DSM 11003]
MTIITTLIIIAVLILVHEWGHFIVARRIGIPVYEFSLGFGYKLFSFNKDGVEYSLRLIPLGGFVRMAGEEPGDHSDPNGFSSRTPGEKMSVAFAGPFMNFILAVLIFVYIYTFIGIPHASDEPVLGKVIAGKPAYEAGLRADDRIVEVNGEKINTWEEFTRKIAATPEGDYVELLVQRGEKFITVKVKPIRNESSGVPIIGVMNKITYTKQNIIDSIAIGLKQTYQLTVLLLSGLWLMITGGASAADLAGPVGITKLVGEAAQVGTVFLLSFTAFLSINLGILNLLPIPALDGSRIVFALVELVRGKPIEPDKEGFIHWLGFIFLMLLIIIVTYNDIVKLIKG